MKLAGWECRNLIKDIHNRGDVNQDGKLSMDEFKNVSFQVWQTLAVYRALDTFVSVNKEVIMKDTVIFLNIRTHKTFDVITLKFELCGSTIE